MSKEIEIEIGTHKLSIVAEDGKTPIKGVDFLTDKEIDEIKKEVTPIKNVDYFDGKDYVLTSADKKEIAKSIDVPIVKEKTIVEKTEVVHEVPVVKEVAVTDTPSEIAEKINTLDKQIDFKVLKNVPEFGGKGGTKLISARSGGGVDSFIKLNASLLDPSYIVNGIQSLVIFARDHSFKDRVICTDVTRRNFIFKDENNNIIKDPKGVKITKKFIENNKPELINLLTQCHTYYNILQIFEHIADFIRDIFLHYYNFR
jgi:hypothetical protein